MRLNTKFNLAASEQENVPLASVSKEVKVAPVAAEQEEATSAIEQQDEVKPASEQKETSLAGEEKKAPFLGAINKMPSSDSQGSMSETVFDSIKVLQVGTGQQHTGAAAEAPSVMLASFREGERAPTGGIEMVARFVPTVLVRHWLDRLQISGDRGSPIVPSEPTFDRFTAAMLFIDISGFTPLSARLGRKGAVGIEMLSRVLNDYFSEQIALVTAHGGDIIKFAGDALMAMWEENLGDSVSLGCGMEGREDERTGARTKEGETQRNKRN